MVLTTPGTLVLWPCCPQVQHECCQWPPGCVLLAAAAAAVPLMLHNPAVPTLVTKDVVSKTPDLTLWLELLYPHGVEL